MSTCDLVLSNEATHELGHSLGLTPTCSFWEVGGHPEHPDERVPNRWFMESGAGANEGLDWRPCDRRILRKTLGPKR